MHQMIVEILKNTNWKVLTLEVLQKVANKDEAIRKFLNVLAATQEIPLTTKDVLRKELKALFRNNFGDRIFFADSDLHRKHRKVFA